MGNKPAALPAAGVTLGLAAGTLGRLPTGRGEVTTAGAGGVGVGSVGAGGAVGAIRTCVGFGVALVVGVFCGGLAVAAGVPWVVGAAVTDGVVGALVGGAVIPTAAVAVGVVERPDAEPVTVRATDVTCDALAGTVSRTWSCRGVDCASTCRRSHADVPSPLAQPELKSGVPPETVFAWSFRFTVDTSPPVAQTLTVHSAACPRTMLACPRVTSMQRLVRLVTSAAILPVWVPLLAAGLGDVVGVVRVACRDRFMERTDVGVADGWEPEGLGFGFAVLPDGVGVGVLVAVFARVVGSVGSVVGSVGLGFGSAVLADGVGVGILLGRSRGCVFFGVDVGVLVAVFVCVVVTVGLGVGLLAVPDLLGDLGGAEDWCLLGVAEGVACFCGLAPGVPVCIPLPLVPPPWEKEVPPVTWVDGLPARVADACSGSHDVLLAVPVALAAAVFAARTMVAPETAVASSVPAISVIVARRACPKRMKRPT